ncbi:MAG TPA: J domain-containing protein [Thermomonas sp.]|jgi:hypothetical protein|uniref:J domain-containing protein n=1 Tax=Thermomonas sp. TaxID=1971895 RepID=UPI002BA4739F|nr:J domain-containing protein [Thermomonas sp.]HOU65172.1 J domain-containing protein [Thermomonas sp.]HPM56822.1 J domain-containing protein [Thermomonas sp.]HPW12642.1 J domain-containing protein [Thermomonas sp.]
MSPFNILGLDRKADLAQVKRAYAKLLRTHRPDEDPTGFQRVHEAYQACLEQLRWREQGWEDEDEDDDGIAVEPDADDGVADPAAGNASVGMLLAPLDVATIPREPGDPASDGIDLRVSDFFDAEAFAHDLGTRLRSETPQAVETWLQAHDDLYALDRKRALQASVVDMLETLDAQAAARHFDTVTRFFGMDTVSGTDSWLHHRLDAIQQRFGDAADFERVLRTHAGPDATWADQGIARELLQPFSWWRRLCLIACPGLPGRTGALLQALQAADPVSASTRLDPPSRRFWERATDRRALRWQRLSVMAVRLALWASAIGIAVSMLDEKTGFDAESPTRWATLFAWPYGLWLAYAVVVLGLIRFRDYNHSRMQWDWVLLMTAGGLACGVVAFAAGANGTLAFIMTTVLWIGARKDGERGSSASQGASLAAGATGYGLALLVLHQLVGDSIEIRYLACIAAVYAFGSQAIHDVLLARKRGIALVRARTQTGALWRIFQVQGALLAVLLVLVLMRGKTGA